MLLNIYFLFFVNTRGYPWILKNFADTRITNTRWIWVWIRDIYLSSG